jgi:hypothetical protein
MAHMPKSATNAGIRIKRGVLYAFHSARLLVGIILVDMTHFPIATTCEIFSQRSHGILRSEFAGEPAKKGGEFRVFFRAF